MKKILISLLSVLAFIACAEDNSVGAPSNGNDSGNTAQDAPFGITVEEVHATTAITEIVPEDEQMYYIMYLEQVS